MNINDLIRSDLNSTLLCSKLELVDRWIIDDDGKNINIEIENTMDSAVYKIESINKDMVKNKAVFSNLNKFVESTCHGLSFVGQKDFTDRYNPDTEGRVSFQAFGFDIGINLLEGQKIHLTISELSDQFGYPVKVIDCSSTDKNDFSFYVTENCEIFFGISSISIVYLHNYFEPYRLQSLYTVHNVERSANDFSIINYGLEYIGEFKQYDSMQYDRSLFSFDLLSYNEQQNKDFTKGYVACPFLMTSNGIVMQSEMFLPVRKTEVYEGTRVVYNYLYHLGGV